MARDTSTFVLASAFAIVIALPLVADELPEGIFAGTLVYDGQPYPKPTVSSLPVGKVKNESLLVNAENGGIANVVVALTPNTNIDEAALKPKNVVMRASDTGFSPHVVVLRTGDTLQINNTGAVGHNINIQTIRNAPLNENLSPGGQSTFTPSRPERGPVSLTCSIKSWMAAWIVVSDAAHVGVAIDVNFVPEADLEAKILRAEAKGADFFVVGTTAETGSVRVAFEPKRTFARGTRTGSLEIYTTSKFAPKISVPIRVIFDPIVSLAPTAVVLSVLDSEQAVTIEAKEGMELKVVACKCTSSAISVSWDETKISREHKLNVRLNDSRIIEAQSQSIEIDLALSKRGDPPSSRIPLELPVSILVN